MTTTGTDDVVDVDGLIPVYEDLSDEDRSDVGVFDANKRREIAATVARDRLADVLKMRRFDLLPVTGTGAPGTQVQGREPGDSTTPTELSDLISSIQQMGVLQPILVEERLNDRGDPVRLIVAGERRVRAVRFGATKWPSNPHFQQIPAVIVPGPLSDEDKRSWQLIENLAREDLKPGELAAALLFERCAILVTKLLSHGIPVPRDILGLDSPVDRFEALERLRGKNSAAAAPWDEVFHRLGLQMTARKARQLVAAFKSLPPELVEQMDEERIALSTRIKFIELRKGREQAADEIWAAVKAKQQAKALLNSAVTIASANPGLPADEIAERAYEAHEMANLARADAMAAEPVLGRVADEMNETFASQWDAVVGDAAATTSTPGDLDSGLDAKQGDQELVTLPPLAAPADPELVTSAINALRVLVSHLADGHAPSKYDTGSLRLQARNLLSALDSAHYGTTASLPSGTDD